MHIQSEWDVKLSNLHDRLKEVIEGKHKLLTLNVKKSDPGYRNLNLTLSGIEIDIRKVKEERKKLRMQHKKQRDKEFAEKFPPKKLITKKDVTPVPDEYKGIRCEYCGGETVDGNCVNKSEDWPHE